MRRSSHARRGCGAPPVSTAPVRPPDEAAISRLRFPISAPRSPTSDLRSPTSAFTLIELLTVIAIIGILSAISFGVIRGVKQNAAIAQAKAELAVLAQALEDYKRQYGTYPHRRPSLGAPVFTQLTAEEFYQALNGRLGPIGTALPGGKRFIDTAHFTLLNESVTDRSDIADAPGTLLADPWGRSYGYVYFERTTGGKMVPGYVLYSIGPRDGDEAIPTGPTVVPATTGESAGIVSTDATCAKNLYANP